MGFKNGSFPELENIAKDIRKTNRVLQKDVWITNIASNDFSFYNQILGVTCTVENVPKQFNFNGG